MKKFLIPLLFALIFCQAASTQANETGNNSQKISSTRFVKDNILHSNETPQIEIRIDDEFKFIGKFDFEIIATSDEYSEELLGKPIAAGERFVFVVTNGNDEIEKLFIIQLEGFLPDINLLYYYDFSSAELIGNNKYRHNIRFYDAEESAMQNPVSEGALTRNFLREKGFDLDNQYMMSRFVGLASDDRKNEIIIFYMEMLGKTTGYSLDEYQNSISDKESELIEQSFEERSRKSFNIITG
jgi:hypothetical protein